MSESIDITGLDKAEVLAALWNAAKPPHPTSIAAEIYTQSMTTQTAQEVLDERATFARPLDIGTVNGRRIDVDLSQPYPDRFFYNRANGEGVFERAIDSLRQKQE